MCGCGWVVFFSRKLTLRLGGIAWMFCLNPEFGFGFTLLGTKKKSYISPSRCVQVDVFSGFAILVGYLRNTMINPWKTEKPKRWRQSENINLRELTTERPKQMVQLLISSDLLELSTEPPLRVSF